MILRSIAIDDEPMALEVIKNLSAKIQFIELAAVFTDPFKALDYLQHEKTDLIFLDIKMPDISGIELLKSLAKPPMVIFTTAYSEHAIESFELEVVDYLLKPFSQTRFLKACNRAAEQFRLKNGEAPFFIKSGTENLRVEPDEILYVESLGNYMQFVLSDKKITSRLTMSEMEALLPAARFVRIHRSFIAAKKHITKIDKNSVWVKETELPIGSAFAHEIEKLLK
jgi:two-component system LytT family response regulator